MNLIRIFKQRKTYTILIGSYFAFILISLFVGVWYCTRMKDSVVDSTLKYNEGMIALMKSNVDGMLAEVNYIDYYVEINSKTQKVLKNETLSTDEKYDIMKLMHNLRNGSSLIEDICLYIENEDIIISSRNVISPKLYFANQCKLNGYTFDEWKKKFLHEIGNKKFYPAESISFSSTVSQDVIMYKSSLFSKKSEDVEAHILIMIKADEIRENIENIENVTDNNGFIVDMDGNTILSSGSINFKFDIQKFIQKEKILFKDEKDYVDVYEKSDNSNLIYITRLDKDMIFKDINLFVKIGVFLILLYIILGFILIRFSGYIVYNPIKKILNKIGFGDNLGIDNSCSELEYIDAKIDELVDKEIKYTNQVEELNILKKKALLRSMLMNSSYNEYNLSTWKNKYFMVVAVKISIIDNMIKNSNKIDRFVKYGVLNVLQELMESFAECEFVELENDHIAIIINLSYSQVDKTIENIQNVSKIINKILEEEFDVVVSFAISRVHEGEQRLDICYNEAMAALDFRLASDDDTELMSYDMISGQSAGDGVYYWPANLDEIFSVCVENGDYKSISDIIDEIISTNLKNRSNSFLVNDYIYYNLLGSFMRVASKSISYHFDGSMKYRKEWTLKKNIGVIKEKFEKLCDEPKEKETESLKLLKMIEDYIQVHYMENSISLVEIANNMQVSVQYLTAYFKKHKNTTLLKYITQKRMDYAKELLGGSSLTLGDIALRVGYTDASVFAKVFKKTEGITPGKYRTMAKEQ